LLVLFKARTSNKFSQNGKLAGGGFGGGRVGELLNAKSDEDGISGGVPLSGGFGGGGGNGGGEKKTVSGGFGSGGGGFDDGGRVEGGEKVVSGGLGGGREAESRDETLFGDGVGAKLLSDGLNGRRGT
jgi:hypothetical protein